MIVIGRIEMCVVSIGLWLFQILLLYLAHQLILARGLVADFNGVIKCRYLRQCMSKIQLIENRSETTHKIANIIS